MTPRRNLRQGGLSIIRLHKIYVSFPSAWLVTNNREETKKEKRPNAMHGISLIDS